MKFLHNKNIWIILALVLVILAVLAVSRLLPGPTVPVGKEENLFTGTPAEQATESPAVTVHPTEPAEVPEEPAPTAKPARGYVLVQTANQYGFLALPEEGEQSVPVRQVLKDGTETVNVIHLTPHGVYMESSTCENQDCVGEGIVTLENKAERVLGNYILCLPNRVTLQLFTPEELLEISQGE